MDRAERACCVLTERSLQQQPTRPGALANRVGKNTLLQAPAAVLPRTFKPRERSEERGAWAEHSGGLPLRLLPHSLSLPNNLCRGLSVPAVHSAEAGRRAGRGGEGQIFQSNG